MIPHYHLINCDSMDILIDFIKNKEIGIRMPFGNINEINFFDIPLNFKTKVV